MNYIEVTFSCTPHSDIISEILSANLADIGFESFVENNNGVTAYIQEKLFDTKTIENIVGDFPMPAKISYSQNLIVEQNWNEEWEKNYFQPLIIDNKCIIKSTFHKESNKYEYSILIDPKMAFGTGHHQTTELMIREVLNSDFTNKSVLDMGCGTAILAILASMRGANPIVAIDIDEWAYENAKENIALNKTSNIVIEKGGAELLNPKKNTFDIILANINRNILLNDIHVYSSVLNEGGALYMSGFYVEDIAAIEEECIKCNLTLDFSRNKDKWASVKFSKR